MPLTEMIEDAVEQPEKESEWLRQRRLSEEVGRAIGLTFADGNWWGPHPSMQDQRAYASASLGLKFAAHYYTDSLPRFASEMSATMGLVRWMQTRAPNHWQNNLRLIGYAYARTYAKFSLDDGDDYEEGNGEHATEEAICRAALAALTVRHASSHESPPPQRADRVLGVGPEPPYK